MIPYECIVMYGHNQPDRSITMVLSIKLLKNSRVSLNDNSGKYRVKPNPSFQQPT